jgi:glutathione S-transferase
MPSDLLLYVDSNFLSPYAMSAFVALQEKGVAFTLATLDLDAGAQRRPDYVALSLTAKVPTLVQGDFALSESSAIAEYVDETFPGTPLYPKEPRARAKARQVQAWLRSDLMPIRHERSSEGVYLPVTRKPAPLSAEAQAAAERLFAAVDRLLPAGAENLFGAWSIADADLAVMLNRLLLPGDPVPARLADYARHQWQLPSIQAWLQRARRAPG